MYFPVVFLFDVGEEGGITEIPFAAWTSVLSLLLFIFYDDCVLVRTLLVTHQNIINLDGHQCMFGKELGENIANKE